MIVHEVCVLEFVHSRDEVNDEGLGIFACIVGRLDLQDAPAGKSEFAVIAEGAASLLEFHRSTASSKFYLQSASSYSRIPSFAFQAKFR